MIWYVMWYDMLWYDMWCDMIWNDVTWYDMMWYDMMWYDIDMILFHLKDDIHIHIDMIRWYILYYIILYYIMLWMTYEPIWINVIWTSYKL